MYLQLSTMEATSSKQPLRKKLSSAGASFSSSKLTSSDCSQSTTDSEGFLDPARVSAGADDENMFERNALPCNDEGCQADASFPVCSGKADSISQQEVRTRKKTRINFCARNASKGEAVGGEEASSTLLLKLSSRADDHNPLKENNTSPLCKTQNFDPDAEYFLRVVGNAGKSRSIEQHFTWNCRVPTSTSAPDIVSAEESSTNHTDSDAAIVTASHRSAAAAPDILAARNPFLFSPYTGHSLVTVHLLPCRFAFTGPAPVRKYFRPWRLPVNLSAHIGETWGNVATSTESLSQHEGNKLSATPAPSGNRDAEEKHSQGKPRLGETVNNGVNTLVCPERPSCSSDLENQASLSRVNVQTNQETENSQKTLDSTSLSRCEGTVDVSHEDTENISSPELYEALLHGRLLRGVSLPLAQCTQFLCKEKHTEYHTELETNPNFSLTDDVQGYIVVRRTVDGAGHVEGETPVPTAAHTGESIPTELETPQQKQSGSSACSAHAQAAAEKNPEYEGVAELVPVARIKQLCYWNHDSLPTPLDDVPQALAFMQLARIVHSMTDD